MRCVWGQLEDLRVRQVLMPCAERSGQIMDTKMEAFLHFYHIAIISISYYRTFFIFR